MLKIKPFNEINIQLLNDVTDQSSIELDGILLVSGNEFTLDENGQIENDMQWKIHSTIIRLEQILIQYKKEN